MTETTQSRTWHDSHDLDLKDYALGEAVDSKGEWAHVLVRHGRWGREPVEMLSEVWDQRRQVVGQAGR